MKSMISLCLSTIFTVILMAVQEGSTEPLYYRVKQKHLSISLTAHHFVMNNGLNVVVVVDKTAPTFDYHTFYRVGAADEPADQQGAIHFLEHLMFATKTRSNEKLEREILLNGGKDSGAFTSHHYTHFRWRFLRNKLDFAAKLMPIDPSMRVLQQNRLKKRNRSYYRRDNNP